MTAKPSVVTSDVGNEVSELQTVYDKQLVELRTFTNDNDRLSKQLSTYKQQFTDSEQQHKQLSHSIEQLEKEIESSRAQLVTLDKQVLTDTGHVKQLQRRHEAVSTGTAVVGESSQVGGSDDDSRLTNKEKLDKYKEQRGEITTKIKQLQQRVCSHDPSIDQSQPCSPLDRSFNGRIEETPYGTEICHVEARHRLVDAFGVRQEEDGSAAV